MKKIVLPLIVVLCVAALLVLFGGFDYESVLTGVIGGFFGATLWPEITKFCARKKAIKQGIELIKQKGTCSIEELEITVTNKDEENLLIVNNAPRWIYKITTDDSEEQLKLLILDFEKLRKNSEWNNFIAGKTVCFNLYSDESFDKEIIKTVQKQYTK